MNTIWRKIIHDLSHDPRRTWLSVLSIAAGLFAVGGIFGMVDQLGSSMDAAHQAIVPAHLNIILTRYVSPDDVASLRDVDGVVDVELINRQPIRIKPSSDSPDDEWELGILVMRETFETQLYDQMPLVSGKLPAAANEIGVERLTTPAWNIHNGDDLIVETFGGDELTMNVVGTLRHPLVQPPVFGGNAHFFTDAAGFSALGYPDGLYGQLLVNVTPYSESYAKAVADELRAELGAQGVGVASIIFQDPYLHWGRVFADGITLIMQVMAALSLLISVILIFNTFSALISQQTDQIGVMKALGGRRTTITRAYLGMVVILGMMALVISLPAALFFAFKMTQWFLNLFNINLIDFQYAPRAVLFHCLAAVFVPPIAAILPIMRGSNMSVREALATYGLGSDFGSNRLDQVVEWCGRLLRSRPHATALANLFRRKGRLLLTLLTLTTAGVMFMVLLTLITAINTTMDNEEARRQYNVRVGFTTSALDTTILDGIAGIDGLKAAQLWWVRDVAMKQVETETGAETEERRLDSTGLGAQLTAVPDDVLYEPLITSGRWLRPGDGQVIVMNEATAIENGVQVGDKIMLDAGELGATTWEIIGTYRLVYGGGFQPEALFAPRPALLAWLGVEPQGTLLIANTTADDLQSGAMMTEKFEETLRDIGISIDPFITLSTFEERASADSLFASNTGMLMSQAIIMAVVGGMGLAGAVGISVVERTREIGVMRSMGAKSRTILSLFIMEGLLQAWLSWVLAIPIALVVAPSLSRQMGQAMIGLNLDYAFEWWGVVAWLLLVTVIALLASITPARKAAQLPVRESLSYG